MNPRTQALNTSLMVLGAVMLLAIVVWVVTAMSEPLIPNTGDVSTSTEVSTDAPTGQGYTTRDTI